MSARTRVSGDLARTIETIRQQRIAREDADRFAEIQESQTRIVALANGVLDLGEQLREQQNKLAAAVEEQQAAMRGLEFPTSRRRGRS